VFRLCIAISLQRVNAAHNHHWISITAAHAIHHHLFVYSIFSLSFIMLCSKVCFTRVVIIKSLNSIKEIEISYFKKSWSQKIEYLTKMQIEFARNETCKMINTHYRELKTIVKKTKNIVMYINTLQTQEKIAKLKTEIKIMMIFTHESVKCIKMTSVIDEIIITKVKLQAINNAIMIYSEETSENSEIWVYTNSQMTLQRLKAKSNVNLKLLNNIQQNLINL